ncbi:hypothetical protein EG346_16870 [Chryseobacterium carnipullorum]|uniref:Phage tail protein n=1 Tax=Chryseobacterium carnipullorum TaxID=1124835 RepID=A0A376DU59_CHRCU|nr:hypothetical protein [Chryseobacterium carnipullorum]AZA49749.1 hypothetical protein EG346_16870 [Chryseobacterium carnipullorum]AZA64640.1 hypothetical protein EG345_07895 [Chryseobacterium carnipullorum]STC95549.1 Uncharacterised protein [Chryseobacterium carnipullorum]
MSEVKYSINGKYFKDFGVYVSESSGLVGLLERKSITNYEWAEYHGSSPDLRNPKYKDREIELKCFIRGENWETLFTSFREFIIAEFSKKGTQRLHIEPLNYKTLPYEVYMKDDVKPEKTFSEGEMFATFSLKLIEPNPIKKVLRTMLDQFTLSYEIDSETEIFMGDGTKQIGRGNVSFTKSYSQPSYQGSGISLIATSGVNNTYYEAYTIPAENNIYEFSVTVSLQSPKNIVLYVLGRTLTGVYEATAVSVVFEGNAGKNTLSIVKELNINNYGKFIYKVLDSEGNEVPGITFNNARIEIAEVLGEWRDMVGKEKIIIIAGNIENIKNLETPAEEIWSKI